MDEEIAVVDVDGAKGVAECGARVEIVGVVHAARENPTNTTGPRKRKTRLAFTVFSFTRFGVRLAVPPTGRTPGCSEVHGVGRRADSGTVPHGARRLRLGPAKGVNCRILHLMHVLHGHTLRRASCVFAASERAVATG
jgi:hypothetical protein